MVSDIDKQIIEKQAKELLDKFAKALEKAEKESETDNFIERDEFERLEVKASSSSSKDENSRNLSSGVDNNFKEKILKNAPQKDEDFIIAEKGGWK